ncbi:TRAP transporter small permease subunit [Metaplanococcus flavidus]
MIKTLEKAQMMLGVIMLSIFFIAIMIQIVSRHMGISIIWTEEVANYSFIWSVFMGAAVMVNQREHFSFDFLVLKLNGVKKIGLILLIDIIVLLFAIGLLYYGIQAASTFWNYNWVALPEMKMGYVWIALPITGITMAIYTLGHILDNIKDFKQVKRGASS